LYPPASHCELFFAILSEVLSNVERRSEESQLHNGKSLIINSQLPISTSQITIVNCKLAGHSRAALSPPHLVGGGPKVESTQEQKAKNTFDRLQLIEFNPGD